MNNTFKPCPFCGSPAHLWEAFGKLVIGCRADKCNFKPDTWLNNSDLTDIKEAAAIWNKRADK